MKQKIDNLEKIKDKLCNWKSYDEIQLQTIIEEFEKIPREEFSSFYTPILTDNSLIENIIEIGEAFKSNTDLLVNVISSLGNIVWRYKLNPSAKAFSFFTEVAKNKKVSYYISLYITSFPQYRIWEDKWNYLVSMPDIVPKKKSMTNFHTEVKNILRSKENIPSEVKKNIINILNSYVNLGLLSDYSQNDYFNTIRLLKSNDDTPKSGVTAAII